MSTATVIVYKKRRTLELFMVIFACGLALGAYLLTHLNTSGTLPTQWPWVVGLWSGGALVAHLVVRFRLPYADPLLLPLALLLNGLGLVMIHRLDLAARAPFSNDARQQLMWTGLGLVCFVATMLIVRDHRVLARFPYLLFGAGLVLLLLPLVPGLGVAKQGARIWIHLGPLSFQPGEIAKLVLAIAFAGYLVEKRDVLSLAGARILGVDLPRPRDLGPILVVWVVSILVLVFETDLGTSLLFFGMFVMMLYVATERPSWPILGVVLFSGAAVAGYFLFGHVRRRFTAWLDPFGDYANNYQIIAAQFGLDWGGVAGAGLGLGSPWLIPVVKSDMIIAALGEELGMAGLMAIVVCYAVIVARGLRAALAAQDPFDKLLAAGLAFAFALQVFIIIGGVTRLLPLTGLTTPFMSQGGTSLIANWILIALLMIISHRVRQPIAPDEAGVEADFTDDSTQVIAHRVAG